jgi:hypothetical protein
MSISGILSTLTSNFDSQSIQSRTQQFRKDFQQLGQDLQTGNLAGARADFAALQMDGPQRSSSQSSDPIAQVLHQLSTDLQSGNLTAAQQDYNTLQQDFQSQASQLLRPHHRHHHSGGSQGNGISDVLSQLGQDLQTGDLAAAQIAYSTLQQGLQQYAIANGALDSERTSTVNASA